MSFFSDGFDCYRTATALAANWDAVSMAPGNNTAQLSIAPTSGRNGGGALFFNVQTIGQFFSPSGYILKNLPQSASSAFTGVAFMPTTASSGNSIFLSLMDGSTTQVNLGITPAGQLYATRNGTTLTLSQNLFVRYNAWNSINFDASINGTTGTVTVRLNGVAATFSGNTQGSSTTNISGVRLEWAVGFPNGATIFPVYFDDFYYTDVNEAAPFNASLGDVSVGGYFPTGNGSVQNFAAAFATIARSTAYSQYNRLIDGAGNVQEATTGGTTAASAPTFATTVGATTTDGSVTWTCRGTQAAYKALTEAEPDGDSSYVSDGTVGDVSTFTFPAVPTGVSVLGVVVKPYIKKDAAGTRAIRGYAKSGAATGDSGRDFYLGSSYAYPPQQVLAKDPNTNAAWTPAGVNAAEFGIKVTV